MENDNYDFLCAERATLQDLIREAKSNKDVLGMLSLEGRLAEVDHYLANYDPERDPYQRGYRDGESSADNCRPSSPSGIGVLHRMKKGSDTERNGVFIDAMGACKVCDGEIPYGHTDNCDIWLIEKERNELRKQIVYGFYEEEYPSFSQGPQSHELISPVTAEELNHYFIRIKKLEEENKKLKELLVS